MYESPTPPAVPTYSGGRRFRIVVGLDLSEYSEIVLEHALDQAARHDAPDLHIITVRENSKVQLHDVKASLLQLATRGLEAFSVGAGNMRARLHVRSGKPAEEISTLAADILADLVVVGRFGRYDHENGRIGTVADRVIRLSPCPALVVVPTEHASSAQLVCSACAALRDQTHGDVIFCASHAAGPSYVSTSRSESPPQ